jgi:hypothetical protein
MNTEKPSLQYFGGLQTFATWNNGNQDEPTHRYREIVKWRPKVQIRRQRLSRHKIRSNRELSKADRAQNLSRIPDMRKT